MTEVSNYGYSATEKQVKTFPSDEYHQVWADVNGYVGQIYVGNEAKSVSILSGKYQAPLPVSE